ncbi:DNA (cytosine-5-)-methyltransferase [Arthrobacter sp. AL08]|uniref:DNA cytosine methyltransferase n=1 Tax=Micrococcaceae TaxID=1268 RepID=UPI00249B252D|nr:MULTISPECIES: DNA (cytosine-5-)-methyltransferase [Micrococcaceae]MDI3242242.1 DNA (cytosine-5-)-methyltransferase [Arthrobacter sp. AL05]MDI3278153.1 DNA (cytosine-5-)-methyltransferase [Arthrobacter sp. AL08]MDJ0353165.1 DNA (cytosine-5-)-methyltransferase [Pseudarthrobacter sp. PH31-O2]
MNQVQSLPPLSRAPLRAAEFFAGIGLVRAGLEPAGFEIVWANDYEPAKKEMYEGNFGSDHDFALGDIAKVKSAALPEDLDFAWASFPCTDLSLAGDRRGLAGKQSGTFFHFTRIMDELEDKKPRVIALENVNGLATSHGGDDMAALARELNGLGYSVDVLALDGRRFVAQSRPRIFIVGSMDVPVEDTKEVSTLRPEWLQGVFQDPTVITHRAALPEPPEMLTVGLSDVVETMGARDSRWWDAERKDKFLTSLSVVQRERLDAMKASQHVTYRTAYRRTRSGVPVWEIRADEVSGCLRTARGGSSKQAVVMAGRGRTAVRWMTPVEYARLMGAGDYNLSGLRDSQILFGFGDAVVVPAVQWVGENYLAPLIRGELRQPARLERVAG